MDIDYLVVGSGLTGGVIARLLTDEGYKVLIIERRSHWGGNVHDHTHQSGIRIHTYGPHYFRTSSERIWNFVNRFATFYPYSPSLLSLVDGKLENWPVTQEYLDRVIGTNWAPAFKGRPTNFEEASLSMMPRVIYDKFVKNYSEKQWGVPLVTLSKELARRFDVRRDLDTRLKQSQFQGLPDYGYTELMRALLKGIPLVLNFDYTKNRQEFNPRLMTIFTGPIDEYFGFQLGRLEYRAQRREEQYYPNETFLQPCGQINSPSPSDAFVRTIEWKHLMPPTVAGRIKGTVLTREYPYTPADPETYEYPFPDEKNRLMLENYKSLARQERNVIICGRLGEYRYYDMDQAIGRAMVIAGRLIKMHDEITVQGGLTSVQQSKTI